MRQDTRPGRGTRILSRVLIFGAIALIVVVVLDIRLRPAVETLLASQARMTALRTINTSMLETLAREDIAYRDIVHLARDDSGSVTSIETDIVAVNQLKSRMSTAAAQELEQAHNQKISIPVGTLVGGNLLSGRGPSIEILVLPAGYVQTELYNEFLSAGINQTLHRIMLETRVQMVAVLPGYRVHAAVSTNFCVAETVIVGGIPEGYTIVGEDTRSPLSKMHDYKAE